MDWVNFELGEDIAHTAQDLKWGEVKQDARTQISKRPTCITDIYHIYVFTCRIIRSQRRMLSLCKGTNRCYRKLSIS